jgi:hypothetical protein
MKALDNLGMCYYYKGNTKVAEFYHSRMDTLQDESSSNILVGRLDRTDRSAVLGNMQDLLNQTIR